MAEEAEAEAEIDRYKLSGVLKSHRKDASFLSLTTCTAACAGSNCKDRAGGVISGCCLFCPPASSGDTMIIIPDRTRTVTERVLTRLGLYYCCNFLFSNEM